MQTLSWEEVAKHNNSDDCWLVVDGDVYDVTSWVSQHPGGEVIAALAGEDASAMIHGAHLIDLASMLERYKIGQLDHYQSTFTTHNDAFLTTLKHRVKQYFKDKNIDYRKTSNSYTDISYTVILLLLCWYCLYFLPPWGIVAAIPMGLATCSLIGSFAHERIHGNLFATTSTRHVPARISNILLWGILIPLMPERYFQYEHIKHHNHPMNPDEDYDVYALQYFLRLSPDTQWRKHHGFQHLYAPLIYSIYIFIQVIAGYITPFFDRRNILQDRGGMVDVSMMKLVAITFHIAIPVYLTSFWWVILCGSLYFLTWQAAIYITSGLPHMTGANHATSENESWAHYVCRTTVNLKCGNRFYDWLCGGLNYHLAHHLLPSIPREHLAKIMPIVKATCNEFAYPCVCYDSFFEYYNDHYKFLVSLGKNAQPDAALELK